MQQTFLTAGLDAVDGIDSFQTPRQFDHLLREALGSGFIGVDEAGRGPLAGPVTAAAVVLDPENIPEKIRDSKTIREGERETLFKEIQKTAIASAIIFVDEGEIDRVNILNAALSAMQQAVQKIGIPLPVLVDGNQPVPLIKNPQRSLVKGDGRSASIGAASILAKVARDRFMKKIDLEFPEYGFAVHKGYPTAYHKAQVKRLGPCKYHRKTFRGVKND